MTRGRALLVAGALMLAITAAAPAQAEPGPGDTADVPVDAADNGFLTALRAAGLSYGQPDQAVKAGRTLCDLADSGKTDGEILAILMKHNEYLSNAHANTFMDIAYQVYCPGYLAAGG